MGFSTYGPNFSKKIAIVALDDKRPSRAYWPMRFIQLFGGKRWSLSICIFTTPKPILVSETKGKE